MLKIGLHQRLYYQKKDGSVRFISDFRKLNEWIIRSPHPIPKIQDMLHKLEGFMYATSLDLNMDYYHIKLNPDAQKHCTIITQWGCLSYLRLNFVCCYIDDVLTISKTTFMDHLHKVEEVLYCIQQVGLKVNAKKIVFC
jgi:hypothetical protein